MYQDRILEAVEDVPVRELIDTVTANNPALTHACMVWPYDEAPSVLQGLSTCPIIESGWIAYLPPGIDEMWTLWLESMDCDNNPQFIELSNGGLIAIGRHG